MFLIFGIEKGKPAFRRLARMICMGLAGVHLLRSNEINYKNSSMD